MKLIPGHIYTLKDVNNSPVYFCFTSGVDCENNTMIGLVNIVNCQCLDWYRSSNCENEGYEVLTDNFIEFAPSIVDYARQKDKKD